MGKKRKELSIQDGDDNDSSASHPHVNHSSARPPIAKKTKTSAAKKSKPEAAAEPSTNQHEPKKSQQVVLSAANRSLMTYSPGPLNQEAQKDSPPSQDSTPEADIEFVSLALYGYRSYCICIYICMYSITYIHSAIMIDPCRIFDGMVEVTSLSAFSDSLIQKDPSFSKQQVDSCLHHLEMKNKIMIFNDEIYLI